ncbi:MAG TPA: phenylalanine--tRNA ligase subunit beta, partial [Candidatus Nanoarchaeia archaeon]|nr:phenylalanine--tRNA ligase subunit beta [Candidatus Nanoarchaeia archaeon]
MKVSAAWLNEYLDRNLSTAQLSEALEAAGIEIEQVISSKKLDKKVVVGLTKKVVQHSDADRLKLVEVAVGKDTYKVVCGAPNVRPNLKIALALPGAQLPDGTVIKATTIRGQDSNGMICSAMELGISDDHAGIIELDDSVEVGSKVSDLWPSDDIIDVKSHANRADLQSIVGLAREAAAISGRRLKPPSYGVISGQQAALGVEIEAKDLALRYMAADVVVDAGKTTPSWMSSRLLASGIRPISLLVDITNYVMLELGQPLHAFDATKVKLPIIVRLAKAGEAIETLDGVKRKLTARDLIIADAKGPIALAGVMGGAASQITEQTKRIILESATFDGASVRKTAQRHGLRTESSARFERRLPVQLAPLALDRAMALYIELAGGQPSAQVADHLQIWPWVQHIGVRPSKLSKLFGAKLDAKTIVESLKSLDFIAEQFDIVAEARKHLGKPYVFGAKFKTHGANAFDCSYLIDYVYSLIGTKVGHTALGQYELGKPVHTGDLRPGDVLFYEGVIEKSATDHFYTLNDDKTHTKHSLKQTKKVGHNGIYIGNGLVIHAATMGYVEGEWKSLPFEGVSETSLETFTNNPGYLGARRYVEDLDDYVAVTAPWWRPDVRTEEDVLEEVGRMVGYDTLKPRLPAWQPTVVKNDRFWPKVWLARSSLQGLGMFEVITYSFVSKQLLQDFSYDLSKHLKLKNPLSTEQEYLRSELLPSLVSAVSRNANYNNDFGLYELSNVYKAKAGDSLPEEPRHLGVVSRKGYMGVKAALDLLGREFHIEPTVKPRKSAALHPARAGQVWLG